jgi:futalosine hydrolase
MPQGRRVAWSMHPALEELLGGKTLLLAAAADSEARAVFAGSHAAVPEAIEPWKALRLTDRAELVVTGVGKAHAAAGTARVLDASRHGLLLSVGIAGGYPPCQPLEVVSSSACVLADEGVAREACFDDLAKLGFPPFPGGMALAVSPRVQSALQPFASIVGPIATVSTCSGTDALSREIAARTGAVAEAMEGAAVALVASRLGVDFGELRVISNTTGRRERQVWKVREALAKLSEVIGGLLAVR